MSHVLDTSTCVFIVRDVPLVSSRFAQHPTKLHVSVLSVTALEMWLLMPRTPLRYRQSFHTFIGKVNLLDVTEPIAHRAAMIGHGLRGQSQRVGVADLLIAATVLECGLILVTPATQRFGIVPGLPLIDWSIP